MKLVTTPRPGCVVEYMHGNRPQLAWTIEVQTNRLRLLTITGRENKLSVARVLPWTGPVYPEDFSRADIQKTLDQHQKRREQIRTEIDPLQIWELAQGEVQEADILWLAGVIWKEPDTDQLAALGRSLLECKTHFKFSPPLFKIYPQALMESKIAEARAEEHRQRIISAGEKLFPRLWESRETPGGCPEVKLEEDIAEELQSLLLEVAADDIPPESKKIWDACKKGLPDDPLLPFLLARSWGLLPPHHNFLLDRAGYAWTDEWSLEFEEEIQKIEHSFKEREETPVPLPLVSIDAASTRDIDDAFHLEKTDSGFQLSLAISCPVIAWDEQSPLGKAVRERATSLYLPEGESHMLPEKLGLSLFSLKEQESKPALVFSIRLDSSGNLIEVNPAFQWVLVNANLTYIEVEEDLANHGGSNFFPALELARKLREGRVKQGAVILEQPDPDISIEEENGDVRVHLDRKPACPNAQLIVSEFMILANSAVAAWAEQMRIPLFYRTQSITLPKGSAGVWKQPHHIYQYMRSLAPAILDTEPLPHASLGVDAYSPISSPLRRYTDFINVLQIFTYLTNHSPRFTKKELEQMSSYISSRLESVGQIQRYRPRYWKLLYLKQQGQDALWPATVVDDNGHFVTLALPREQILVRAPKERLSIPVSKGKECLVQFDSIDPLHNEISVGKAVEKEQ